MPAIRTRPDTLPTGLLLAGAGGFLDAYTFVGRGGVFANAQTGNIVLLGVEAGETSRACRDAEASSHCWQHTADHEGVRAYRKGADSQHD
jgi:uncharacterized protein DUF1275